MVIALRLVGIGEPERAGDQILVLAGPGVPFSAEVGPWCSSFGVVLVLLAYTTIVATGDGGRRRRAFIRGAALVVIGNLVRIGATIVVGVTSGPGSIESFHDGLGTGFAVLYVLVGFAVFVGCLPNPARYGLRKALQANGDEAAATEMAAELRASDDAIAQNDFAASRR